MRRPSFSAVAALVFATSLSLGCRSAGPYGHASLYAPLEGEARATAGVTEYDPVMVQRFPEQWRAKPVSLFAVVTNRGTGPGGAPYLALSLRVLEPRNKCAGGEEESCRVTVSDREHGKLHALVRLSADDDIGEKSVNTGSLVRIVGKIGEEPDPADGTPIVSATFVRHWPRGSYVTSRAAAHMLR